MKLKFCGAAGTVTGSRYLISRHKPGRGNPERKSNQTRKPSQQKRIEQIGGKHRAQKAHQDLWPQDRLNPEDSDREKRQQNDDHQQACRRCERPRDRWSFPAVRGLGDVGRRH